MSTERETPITDRLEYEQECNYEVCWEDECRKIERDLAEAREKLKAAVEALEDLVAYVETCSGSEPGWPQDAYPNAEKFLATLKAGKGEG